MVTLYPPTSTTVGVSFQHINIRISPYPMGS